MSMKPTRELIRISDKSEDSLLRAVQIIRKTKDLSQLRQAQAFLLTCVHGMTASEASSLLGISVNWVYKLRQNFLKGNLVLARNASALGGRRRENMTLAQESRFLHPYFQAAKHGEAIRVSDVKTALEEYLGRKVALSSVYNLLKRHKLMQISSKITK